VTVGERASDWFLRGVLAAALLGALWVGAVVTIAFNAQERRLPPGTEKSFWGFDPHLHVSVEDVQWTDAGEGQRCGVTLRFRNDARRMRVHPSALRVTLVDSAGREYPIESAEPPWGVPPAGADWSLAPGDTATQTVWFALPAGARDPTLWVRDASLLGRLLPGSETSLLHPRRLFALR